jgi:hypothetical protein
MPEKITLILTQDQINILGTALGELPFRVAAPLVHEINKQIAEQVPPAESPAQTAE